jgi:hypothetical protein
MGYRIMGWVGYRTVCNIMRLRRRILNNICGGLGILILRHHYDLLLLPVAAGRRNQN